MKSTVKKLAIGAALSLGLTLLPLANADSISIGTSLNGGTVTANVNAASGNTGPVIFNGSDGSFTTVSVNATGSSTVPEPQLTSNTIDVSSNTAGVLKIFITEQGVTSPTGVVNFASGFTSLTFSGNVTSVEEQTFVDTANGQFTTTGATVTKLGDTTFTSGGAQSVNQTGLSPNLANPFSETEVFTITVTGTANVNDSIDLNVTPEPASMALFGSGLLGLAGMVRRKLRK